MNNENEKIKAEVLESKEKNTEEVVKTENNIVNKNEETENMESVKNTSAVALLEKEEQERKNEENITSNKVEQKNNNIQETKNENRYQFKTAKTNKKNKTFYIITVILIIMIIIVGLLSTIFALINSNNDTILSGISVNGTLIEGLTEEEAIEMLNEKFEKEKTREILLKINGETYYITPEQIEVEYNVQMAVEQAYKIGREGNIFQNNFAILKTMLEENNIDVEVTYNEELLENILNGFNNKLPNAMVDNTYCIEDDELIITRGTAGIVVDVESAKQEIINNIQSENNSKIEIKTIYKECPEIDIEKIYSEVKTEPQNASYKKDPFEIIPHKNGLDFDIEEAKKILSEEKDEYVIKLKVIEPDILTNEIGEEAFPDLLSSFSTKYDETNVSRSKNVKIALSKLDGVVVMPGEVFSYNKTLGKRTEEQGYEYANGFAGGKVVPMLAGGICQVSSTLYDAVLYANLNIVERHNHMFQATYVEPGKDATVVYGSLDFKFENTRKYPIMIKTKSGGGLAEIKIFGIKEEVEYEVEIVTTVLSYTPYKTIYENDSRLAPGQERVSQYGLKGCNSITYRIVKLNGQEISKEVLSKDSYSPLDKIVRRGVGKVQETPAEPTVPVEPTTPVEPTIPVESTTPVDSTTPTEPATPEEPTEPVTPTEPIDTLTEE